MLVRVSSANIDWNPKDKRWQVHIHVGSEAIRRPLPKSPQDTSDDTLRSAAVETVKSEGYEVEPGQVTIARVTGNAARAEQN